MVSNGRTRKVVGCSIETARTIFLQEKRNMRCPTISELPASPNGETGWPWDIETPADSSPGPKISIVTPSYNQAGFLEQTIRSVLLQGYSNLEYIIIDGASSDGSVDIIRKYQQHLAYWVSEKDHGAADAIGKGFSKATGSICGWLNSDDFYRPAALQKVVAAFQKSSSTDVVYGNTHWIGRHGEVLAEKRQTPFSKYAYMYGGADLQQPSTFWTRELYDKAGGLDSSFRAAFDTDLFLRFFALGARFRHVAEFLVAFRIHPDQISDVMLKTCQREIETLRARHLTFS